MQNKKIKFAIGSFLIVGAIGFLITSSISSTSKFYFTVDELVASNQVSPGTGLKVKGNVVQGSIARNPEDYLDVAFSIEFKNAKLPVRYNGVTPDMFKDGNEVVVEGTMDRQGVFHANTLMTSCPSKYEAEKEAGKSHPGNIPMDGGPQPAQPAPDFSSKTTI